MSMSTVSALNSNAYTTSDRRRTHHNARHQLIYATDGAFEVTKKTPNNTLRLLLRVVFLRGTVIYRGPLNRYCGDAACRL
jgi:hypothetical protein